MIAELPPSRGAVGRRRAQAGPARHAVEREHEQEERVRVAREHDQPGDEAEQDRAALPRRAARVVPPLGQIQERGQQKERVGVAVRAVERRVVIEARAEQERGERGGGHAIAEVARAARAGGRQRPASVHHMPERPAACW